MVEDLRDDLKEDTELNFGSCADIECLDEICFGIHLSINNTKYVMYMCKKHMEKICKDSGKNPILYEQQKLGV